MTDRRAAHWDLLTGVILFALAVAVFWGAWTMSRLEVRQIHPLTAPGLLPGLLALALGICSLLLIAEALSARRKGPADTVPEDTAAPADTGGSVGTLTLAATLCLVYALGLVGRMPYWLATALFVGSFVIVFEWPLRTGGRQKALTAAWAVGIGLAAGLGIAYAFRDLFLVRLP